MAEHEAARVLADQQPYLGELTSWAAWQRWRDAVVNRYRRQGQHCPLAVLMSELGRTTPAAALLAGVQGGVGILLATGDLGFLEAALDRGIAALRTEA